LAGGAHLTAIVHNAAQVLTCAPEASDGVGLVPGACVALAGAHIAAVGSRTAIASAHNLDGV